MVPKSPTHSMRSLPRFWMILSHSMVVAVQLIAASGSGGTSGANKAIRVEHGRPVILVSHNTVLTLEFLSQSSEKVLIPTRRVMCVSAGRSFASACFRFPPGLSPMALVG